MVSPHARKANAHRTDGINVRGIAIGAAIIAFSIAFSMGVSFVVVRAGSGTVQNASTSVRPDAPPPIAGGVTLQVAPTDDVAAYHAQKQRMLSEYAWVDRDHGIVRIPIDQAIELLVRERSAEVRP